ncbi:MAG TPA: GAF domain-containing sensor histidine kinase [Candidatus Limnocylindria bacterium]|nr:GAF domain-containing sensor histidine kinase [Candidatus Limnocylindria bacterium]
MPDRMALPLSQLLDALNAWQLSRGDSERSQLVDALEMLVTRLGFRGAALSIDAVPLAQAGVACGSLAGASAAQGTPIGGGPDGLGRLRLDPPDGASAPLLRHAIGLALASVHGEARAQRAEGNLAALDTAIRGVAGVLSIDRVLQEIVDRVRELADADYSALGIVDDAGVIEEFVTAGMTAAQRAGIPHLPSGHGLLGLIIRENRAYRIPDIATDPRRSGFPPGHPPMHSFLGVPITVQGRSIGRLYLTDKRGAGEFSEEDQRLVERFALHAGIAMENARLHDRVRRLGIVSERERISRDLHDSIIQRIYGVALSLDDVPAMVREAPAEASERVDRAIDALHATIGEIRGFIFGLRPVLLEEGGLLLALQTLAEEVRLNSAVEIEVHGSEPPPMPIETSAELLSIVRETLSNVARHAGAQHATILLEPRDAELHVEIADDGRGFDPTAPLIGAHQGLRNVADRAARLGATLQITSQPGTGTRIIVDVPYANEQGAEAG